ncbi:MAG: lysophospholipase, partial [Chloroflexota bacterium]|nr:lysophospholipase [Chloroflexota bacterium]
FVLLVVLGGCGGEPSGPSPGGSQVGLERFEVNRQPAVLITPAASTRKVVVYVHGAGETVENIFRDQAKEQIFKTLLQAGYALAANDAHGDSWGNTASERDYLALINALRKRGLRDVYVLALSMGGFNGLQLLGRVPIKAWAGIFPACDLDSVYDLGLYARDIRTAHGLDERGAQPRRREPAARAADALQSGHGCADDAGVHGLPRAHGGAGRLRRAGSSAAAVHVGPTRRSGRLGGRGPLAG